MFKNPFSLKGRIRRMEYGISFISYYLLILVAGYIVYYTEIEEGVMHLLLVPIHWFILA